MGHVQRKHHQILNHKYYLPQDSTEWEFLYFTIYGDVANQLFHQITDAHGHIFKIALHAEPIQYVYWKIKISFSPLFRPSH